MATIDLFNSLKTYINSIIADKIVLIGQKATAASNSASQAANSASNAATSASNAASAATTAVNTAINNLKGGAPAAYDTLGEIATKLAQNDNLAASMLAQIGEKANTANLRGGSQTSILPSLITGTRPQDWATREEITEAYTDPPPGAGRYYAGPARGATSGNGGSFTVDPSIPYYVSFWAKANKAGSRIYIELRDQGGSHAVESGAVGGGGIYIAGNLEIPTTWTKYETIFRFKPGVYRAYIAGVYWNHANGTVRDATQMLSDITMIPLAPLPSSQVSDARTYIGGPEDALAVARMDTNGWLNSRADPTHHNHLARKLYVDNAVSPKLNAPTTGTPSATTYANGAGGWSTPPNTTYSVPSQAEAEAGTATTERAFSAQRVKQAADAAINAKFQVVTQLPASPDPNVIYFIKE